MDSKLIFPDNFLWGAATSGPQSEGRFNKKHNNVFDHWYDIDKNRFFDGIGPNTASNFYNSYKEDIAMLKEIGLNSFRTSIQWTRLIDNFEEGTVNEDGVRFYNGVIDECINNNITPIITLHHFDLPVELYDKYGGWESKYVVDLFVKYAKRAFELFGDRVKYWTTFNEPIVVVEGQYLYEFHYPLIKDGKKAVQVMYNINLASAKAVEAFREGGYNKDGGKIGIILNLTPSYPRSNDEKDVLAARFTDDFFNNSFLDPAIKGEFPQNLVDVLTENQVMWASTEEEINIIKNNTIDFLGVNYYQPRRVKAKEGIIDNNTWMPDNHFDRYDMPGAIMNPYRGWEIYPKSLYDISINLRDNYGNITWYV